MESEKLLPCPNPWCHSGITPMPFVKRSGQVAVICGCDFHGPAKPSREAAIDAWNTRAPAEQTEWRDIETAPKEGFIVGGFFTDAGTRYAQPVVLVCREQDHPSRTEYYAGKQRMFPTHFLTFSPDLGLGTTRAPADLRSALEAETIREAVEYASELREIAGMLAQSPDGPLRWKQYRLVAVADFLNALTALAPTKGDVS